MWGIVPDANCEGHFRVLLRLLHSQRRRELWHFLNLAVLTFDELFDMESFRGVGRVFVP